MPPACPRPRPCSLGSAALACKRLRAACLAPELLSNLECGGWWTSESAHSLCSFLAAHGRHVHSLLFVATNEAGAELECFEQLGRSAAGSLRRLELHVEGLVCAAWLPQLTTLTGLQLEVADPYPYDAPPFRLPAGLSRLAALADLDVASHALLLEGPLPTSLTRLGLRDGSGMLQLPAQVRVWPPGSRPACA